jgi:hypothetical protein
MSESDSCNPGKVAALAESLKTVSHYIGYASELDILWHRCLPPTDATALPRDGSLEDARKNVLTFAAKVIEAVDTAERLLNAIPIEELEPLSPYTDGVRWDVETRRTLKEIQRILSVWHNPWPDLDFLFSENGTLGRATFKKMRSWLSDPFVVLHKRIIDLQCLPDEPTNPTSAIPDKWNGDVQGLSNANTKVSHPTEQAETDLQELEEMERNTPVLDTGSIKWIAARKENQEKLGYPTNTLATYRLKSSGGRQLSPYFGVDKDGRRWRRETEKTEKSTVYYFADDIKKYQRKVSN